MCIVVYFSLYDGRWQHQLSSSRSSRETLHMVRGVRSTYNLSFYVYNNDFDPEIANFSHSLMHVDHKYLLSI